MERYKIVQEQEKVILIRIIFLNQFILIPFFKIGVMMYFSGRLFEGDWQNDTKFGRGFELYPNGNAYEGYFVNGKPEGFGTYIWYNGEIYDGEWINGMKYGSG